MQLLGRLMRLPLRLIPDDLRVRVLAGPLRGMRWIAGSMPHGAWLGRIERDLLEDFSRHALPGMTVGDVGANVGLYTLAAARRVGTSGAVVAFEPIPRNATLLRQHVAMNRLGNVRVVEAAVGAEPGTLRMAAGSSPSEYHADPAGEIVVTAISLDAWWTGSGLPFPQLLKIDVEGAEADVLRGAATLIAAARPRIYLAVHGDDAARQCRAILDTAGYTLSTAAGDRRPSAASEWIALP